MTDKLKSSIDFHTDQYVMLQQRLVECLYDSQREKFYLEEQQSYHADQLCALTDYPLFAEIGLKPGFVPIEKSPPLNPVFYVSIG